MFLVLKSVDSFSIRKTRQIGHRKEEVLIFREGSKRKSLVSRKQFNGIVLWKIDLSFSLFFASSLLASGKKKSAKFVALEKLQSVSKPA